METDASIGVPRRAQHTEHRAALQSAERCAAVFGGWIPFREIVSGDHALDRREPPLCSAAVPLPCFGEQVEDGGAVVPRDCVPQAAEARRK